MEGWVVLKNAGRLKLQKWYGKRKYILIKYPHLNKRQKDFQAVTESQDIVI